MRRVKAWISLLCLASVSVHARVSAQESQAAGEDRRAASNDAFERGVAAQAAGRLDEAYELYSKAWAESFPSAGYEIAANLGQTEAKLGKYREAAYHLSYALFVLPSDAPPGARQELEHVLDVVKGFVGTIRLEWTKAEPPRSITIDEHELASWERFGEAYVDPGAHVIVATAPGFRDFRQEMELEKSQVVRIEIDLVRKPVSTSTPRNAMTAPQSRPPMHVEAASEPADNSGFERTSAILMIGGGLTVTALGGAWAFQRAAEGADRNLGLVEAAFDAKYPEPSACAGNSPEVKRDCGVLADAIVESSPYREAAAYGVTIAGVAAVGTTTTLLLLPRPRHEGTSAARRSIVPVLIGSGLSAAGMAAGFGFLSAASSKADEAARIKLDLPRGNSCAPGTPYIAECSALFRAVNEQDETRDLAAAGFTVAAAEAAGVATYLLWPLGSGAREKQLAVFASPGFVIVRGVF